ncbi:beta-lactamase/transpeptidase-like protein [Trametes meyenii]|nr:beta-lactamase/transpeptidase-like protein [Trametes meyenii]
MLILCLQGIHLHAAYAVEPSHASRVITPGVSAFVQELLDRSAIPGLSLGVVRLDNDRQPTIERASWGRQTEEGDGNDLTPQALFALVSCSKAFLVASVGLLIDDYAHGRNMTPLPSEVKQFDWDTKIQDLLPGEWTLVDNWVSSKANLRDLFGHVTGLPRHDYSYRPGDTAEDVVRRAKHLAPAYELREQWAYNNQGFIVGAHILVNYANTSVDAFVPPRIFEPLNMTSSTYSPSEAAESGRLTQTWTRGVRRIPYWFSEEVHGLFVGAGGAISDIHDMTTWLAMLLNNGVDPVTRRVILPASILADMTTARVIQNGTPLGDVSIIGYGMGWFRMAYNGRDVVWHFGAMPGFSTLVAFLPKDNLGVVIMANMDEKLNETLSILFRVIDEALGLQVQATTLPLSLPPFSIRHLSSFGSAQLSNIPEKGTQTPLSLQDIAQYPLPLALSTYTGTYSNIAYGNITLCAPFSTSPYCAVILNAFAPVEAASGDRITAARLYAAWPRVWSSHIRLRHISGNTFGLVFPQLFPQGYGQNTTAFEFYDSVISVGRVEFVVDNGQVSGFAMITDEAAAAARSRRTTGTVRDVGDAWFEKV